MKKYLVHLPGLLLFTPLFLFFGLRPLQAETEKPRFFLMGDGKISIQSEKTGMGADVDFVSADGTLNDDALTKIDQVFEFPTTEMEEHISPRLLCMLDYFSDRLAPGKVISMESGYRSPEYNTRLRNKGGIVAKTSLHMDGMALDFSIQGVDGQKMWALIRSMSCGGVGYYGTDSIHLDSGRPRFWESDTAKTGTGESDYNRRIYLSTDFDRYRIGDRIRLSLSSVSNFGFGVAPIVSFVTDADESHTVVPAPIDSLKKGDCYQISDRKSSRFLYVTIPSLPLGTYRILIEYCERPFSQMPDKSVSNPVEIW